MSYASNTNPNTNPNLDPSAPWREEAVAPPTHHLHKSSDVLPGAARSKVQAQGAQGDARDPESSFEDPDRLAAREPQEDPEGRGRNAWTEERPLGVQPTERGGVAVGGRADVPETHASAADKLVGKTQKVIGKVTGNPEMHERGELRESGGKDATRGEGRAPHD